MRRISACCKGWCAKKNRLTARVTTRHRGRRQTTMRGESGGRYDLGRRRSTGTKAAPPRPIPATWPRCWLLGSRIREPELGAIAFERERHGADRLGRKGRAGEVMVESAVGCPNDGEPCRHSSARGGGRRIRGAGRGFRAREGQLARAGLPMTRLQKSRETRFKLRGTSVNRAHATRVTPQQSSNRLTIKERLMRRRIGTAAAAFVIFIGSNIVSLAAETGGAPSSGEKGVAGSPSAEGIGSTSSTHNPNPSTSATGMENRSGTEMGSDSSTHNPAGKKD